MKNYNEKMQIFQSETFSKMCGKFVTNSVTSVTILKRTFNKLNHCNTCQPNQNVIFSCFSLEIDYLSFKIALLPFYPLFKQKRIQSEIPPPKRTPALLILVRVSGSKKGVKKITELRNCQELVQYFPLCSC